jgi:hypothetical protein
MRYDLGGFDRENKIRPDLLRPGSDDCFSRHAVKGVVDLHRIEAPGIKAEHFPGRDLLRIESSFPFTVTVPACAGVDFHREGSSLTFDSIGGNPDGLVILL